MIFSLRYLCYNSAIASFLNASTNALLHVSMFKAVLSPKCSVCLSGLMKGLALLLVRCDLHLPWLFSLRCKKSLRIKIKWPVNHLL